jgi:hypothetical protein
MRYPVTLTKDDNDTDLVTFPDMPRCRGRRSGHEHLAAMLWPVDVHARTRSSEPQRSGRPTPMARSASWWSPAP